MTHEPKRILDKAVDKLLKRSSGRLTTKMPINYGGDSTMNDIIVGNVVYEYRLLPPFLPPFLYRLARLALSYRLTRLMAAKECAVASLVFLWPRAGDWQQLPAHFNNIRQVRGQILDKLARGGVPVGIIRVFDVDIDVIKLVSYQILSLPCLDANINRLAPIAIESCLKQYEEAYRLAALEMGGTCESEPIALPYVGEGLAPEAGFGACCLGAVLHLRRA
jgi:hypothetical protein